MTSTEKPQASDVKMFCGWKVPHKEHVATDIVDGSEVFVCPGWDEDV